MASRVKNENNSKQIIIKIFIFIRKKIYAKDHQMHSTNRKHRY